MPRYQVKLVKNAPKPSVDDSAITSYQMGLDFFGLGQYAQVFQAFEDAYDAGHLAACIRLHWLHSGSSGIIPANPSELAKYAMPPKETMAWLKQKANFRGENDQEAQFNLGWCYQNGLGVEVNPAKAAQYYWVAATQGHRDAQYQLGVCCSSGVGVKQDMRQATVYYEQAAKQGHVHAHYVLSQCYAFGLGVLPDAAKAATHRQAAQKGRHPQLVTQPMGGMGVFFPTTTSTIPPVMPQPVVLPCNHPQEIAELNRKLQEQGSRFNQLQQQLNQTTSQLNQALWAEKQASQNKDQQLRATVQELQLQQQKNRNFEEAFTKKEAELTAKDIQNQRLSNTIGQLESALQTLNDQELSLKMQLNEYQKGLQSPMQRTTAQSPLQASPAHVNSYSAVFHPLPPSHMNLNQVPLTASQQVETMAKTTQNKINPEELKALFKWVTEGHLLEVEKLLKKNPTLTLGTGTVKGFIGSHVQKYYGITVCSVGIR